MTKHILDTYGFIAVAALALSIGLSPSLTLGTIGGQNLEIRLEDIFLGLFILIWLFSVLVSRRATLTRPPFFMPIVGWLAATLIGLLMNVLVGDLHILKAVFFYLKELQYFFIYFFIATYIRSVAHLKQILRLWFVIISIHTLWVAVEVLFNLQNTYYYGPTLFIEPQAPFISGGISLLFFLLTINFFLYYVPLSHVHFFKKIIIAVLAIAPVVGVISSGSRTTFFAFLVSIVLIVFLYVLKLKTTHVRFCIISACLMVFLAGFMKVAPRVPGFDRLVDKNDVIQELSGKGRSTRANIWIRQLSALAEQPLFLVFGFGKSFLLAGEQSHNYFIQTVIDGGIVGFFMFIAIMLGILYRGGVLFLKSRNNLSLALSATTITATSAMLILSLGSEAFKVVKLAELYWFIVGMMGSFLLIQKKEKQRP